MLWLEWHRSINCRNLFHRYYLHYLGRERTHLHFMYSQFSIFFMINKFRHLIVLFLHFYRSFSAASFNSITLWLPMLSIRYLFFLICSFLILFYFLPSPPSFLLSSLHSFFPPFFPSFLPSFLLSLFPLFFPPFIPFYLPSFLSSSLYSFLLSFIPFFHFSISTLSFLSSLCLSLYLSLCLCICRNFNLRHNW